MGITQECIMGNNLELSYSEVTERCALWGKGFCIELVLDSSNFISALFFESSENTVIEFVNE